MAIGYGIDDTLFWNLSIPELEAAFNRFLALEKKAMLRAGLIAATIVNVHRKPGSTLMQPSDFIREPRKESDYMTVEESRRTLKAWAAGINADLARAQAARLDDDSPIDESPKETP